VPKSAVLEDLDETVARAFARALSRLSAAGAAVVERPVPALDRQDVYFKGGGFAGAEAAAIHRPWADRIAEYDPRVGKRIALGNAMTGADYVELGQVRAAFLREMETVAAPFDAILMPTVPCVAPTIAEVDASDDAYFRWNLRALRNCGLANFMDACAVTLPCHAPGEGPVGLMVCGLAMTDRRTLSVAAAIERALAA
jgi:aspartyl-tRNA(Asn)/glutamyl-tRNA(Gln) amidotransferase subunit A